VLGLLVRANVVFSSYLKYLTIDKVKNLRDTRFTSIWIRVVAGSSQHSNELLGSIKSIESSPEQLLLSNDGHSTVMEIVESMNE
jgi:hypothetical protein